MQPPEPTGRAVTLTVEEGDARLDVFLSRAVPELTRSLAQRLARNGLVQVNGRPCRPSQNVRSGDVVTAHIPSGPCAPQAEHMCLAIIYEDEDVVVLDKTAGMVVHPAPGHPVHTLVNALLARYPSLDGVDPIRPGIVHRLDKDTSGLMVVALNTGARDWLVDQFKAGAVHKTYLALAVGEMKTHSRIEGAIGRHPIHRKRMAVLPGGKPAQTDCLVRERLGAFTLIEARPVTGRTHQIRVHCASTGHPVVGDSTYGKRPAWRPLEPFVRRQFLHAAELSLHLPHDPVERRFTSPLPADLCEVLDRARALAGSNPCPPESDML